MSSDISLYMCPGRYLKLAGRCSTIRRSGSSILIVQWSTLGIIFRSWSRTGGRTGKIPKRKRQICQIIVTFSFKKLSLHILLIFSSRALYLPCLYKFEKNISRIYSLYSKFENSNLLNFDEAWRARARNWAGKDIMSSHIPVTGISELLLLSFCLCCCLKTKLVLAAVAFRGSWLYRLRCRGGRSRSMRTHGSDVATGRHPLPKKRKNFDLGIHIPTIFLHRRPSCPKLWSQQQSWELWLSSGSLTRIAGSSGFHDEWRGGYAPSFGIKRHATTCFTGSGYYRKFLNLRDWTRDNSANWIFQHKVTRKEQGRNKDPNWWEVLSPSKGLSVHTQPLFIEAGTQHC